jgi:hypothetical protein
MEPVMSANDGQSSTWGNLLGTWSAFDALPNYTEPASQGASQELVAVSQNRSSGGTTGSGVKMKQSIVSIGQSHIAARGVTNGHTVPFPNWNNGDCRPCSIQKAAAFINVHPHLLRNSMGWSNCGGQ